MKVDENRFRRYSGDGHRARTCDFTREFLGLKVSEEMMGGKWIEYDVGEDTLAIANVGEQWTAIRSRDRRRLGDGRFRRRRSRS